MRTTVFDRPMSEALARLRAAMAAETSPLDGPHLTGREIVSDPEALDEPRPEGTPSKTAQRMTRLLAGQED